MKKRTCQNLLALTLLIPVTWMGVELLDAIRVRQEINDPKDAEKIYRMGDEARTLAGWRKLAAEKQSSPARYWLITRSEDLQWAILYGVAGLAGALSHLLFLMIVQSNPGVSDLSGFDREYAWDAFVARILIGGIFGVCVFVILKLPSALAMRILPALKGQDVEKYGHGSLVFLPFLAGMFAIRFWVFLGRVFQNFFSGKGPGAGADEAAKTDPKE